MNLRGVKFLWYSKVFVIGLSILVFFSLIYVNFNALVNVSLSAVKNFALFSFLSSIDFILFYLFLSGIILLLIINFSRTLKIKFYNVFFEKKDVIDYSIQNDLVKIDDIFSEFELKNRLNSIFLIKPKKFILLAIFFLFISITFSFKFFKINFHQNVFDKYFEKFSYNFDKNFYVEGDSIFLYTDFDNNGLIQVILGNYSGYLSKGRNFLGIASVNEERVLFRLNSFEKEMPLKVISKPKIREFKVFIKLGEIFRENFSNVTQLYVFENAEVQYELFLENAKNNYLTGNFEFKNDTILDFYFCNDFVCDSFQVVFVKKDISVPSINYTKVNNRYVVSVTDQHGLRKIQINNKNNDFTIPKTSTIIELDTNTSYTVVVTNIFNKSSRIHIGNKNSLWNSLFSSQSSNDLQSQYLDSLENEILSYLNNLSEMLKANSLSDIQQTIDRYLNDLEEIRSVFVDQFRISQLNLLIKEAKRQLQEYNNDRNKSQELASELFKQKLQNTLNRYRKENKRKIDNGDNTAEVGEINSSEQIILEGLMLSFNNLSLDIENNKYKNNRDLLNNSNLTILYDSLAFLIKKNKSLQSFLIDDLNRLKYEIQNSSDLKTFMYSINSLSVRLYQILKNVEQSNLNSNKNNSSENNSNCSNPGNTGNSKKPGLSELLGEDSGDGKEDSENTSNKNQGNKTNDNSKDNNSGNDNSTKKSDTNNAEGNKEKKSGDKGSMDSLEDLERKLKDKISSGNSFLDEIKRRIKWLDTESSKRLNEDIDNKRKGNYVDSRDVEMRDFKTTNKDNILYINRKDLILKSNVRY